jgi:uncharacterized protein
MRTVEDVAKFVGGQPHLMALLRAVETLAIDDCWIGAGAIRNAVWDHLHDYPSQLAAGSDVDVVYFDSLKVHSEIDLERRLTKNWPSIPWSVCNQARMHERNGDPPYRNTEDAVRCWPETATAVAARLRGGRVQIIAPHGVDDLVHLNVRPTPVFRKKLTIYERRLASKQWARHWPRLTFL